MNNNIRALYLYVVAFITLVMIVTGVASTVNSIATYFYPDAYVFFYNESSSSYNYSDYTVDDDENEIEKENYKTEQIKNAVVSVVVVMIGAIMHKYHWNLIKKEKNK